MLSEKILHALNKQINKELFSSYLYISMSAYCSLIGLKGFAHWMNVQHQEELVHATKLYNYILDKDSKVIFDAIEKPPSEWKNIMEVIEKTKNHEHHITNCINSLVNLSIEEKDHATTSFLKWFVDEQVEEEASVKDVLDKLKLAKEENALLILDQELSKRGS